MTPYERTQGAVLSSPISEAKTGDPVALARSRICAAPLAGVTHVGSLRMTCVVSSGRWYHAQKSVFTCSDHIAILLNSKVVRTLARTDFQDLATQSARMQATILEAFALPVQPTK
jgi:hypothetical protein